MAERYLVGIAWPYANNSLHVGHLAALLPGDVIARYGRLKGCEVIMVSGSDMHGTPITERAKREGTSPRNIAMQYHEEFSRDFRDLLFSFDLYTNTDTDWHKEGVKEYFRQIDKSGWFFETNSPQDFCETCNSFLSDREIEGDCPVCGKTTRGDQCDHCMAQFDSDKLKNKRCRTCHNTPSTRVNRHLMFKLSAFQSALEEYFAKAGDAWRLNAVNETKKYLTQGLPDRAVSRDLEWGVEIPREGYENKRVYVWFEAVLGYLTSAEWVCKEKGISYEDFIAPDGKLNVYYIHGKDNITFHTVILPALQLANGKPQQLPTHIVSSEYVNMNDEKMSKSKGNLITVHELATSYPVDAVRFYTILFNPERRDVNFSIPEMIQTYNKFLVGGFGNFINRNLSFIKKKFDGVVPSGKVDERVREHVRSLYNSMGDKIEAGENRSYAEDVVEFIQYANKYYDESKPWVAAKEDMEAFGNITATCLYMAANMANLFAPLIPCGAEALAKLLGIKVEKWEEINLPDTFTLGDVAIIYNRIDEK